jgi:hypothetical protein
MRAQHSPSTVIGFSVTTRQPASRAATMQWSWAESTVVTTTSSMPSRPSMAVKSAGSQRVAAGSPAPAGRWLWERHAGRAGVAQRDDAVAGAGGEAAGEGPGAVAGTDDRRAQ